KYRISPKKICATCGDIILPWVLHFLPATAGFNSRAPCFNVMAWPSLPHEKCLPKPRLDCSNARHCLCLRARCVPSGRQRKLESCNKSCDLAVAWGLSHDVVG